jgi:hypothetical protein
MDAGDAERTRTRLLLGGLIFFVIWEGLRLAERLFAGSLDRTTRQVLIIGSLLGWLGWSYYLIRTVSLGRIVRSTPGLESTLNDEFIQLARLKAFRAGFVAVMLAQIVPIAFTIPGPVAGQLSILVGVATTIGGFLIYERA